MIHTLQKICKNSLYYYYILINIDFQGKKSLPAINADNDFLFSYAAISP